MVAGGVVILISDVIRCHTFVSVQIQTVAHGQDLHKLLLLRPVLAMVVAYHIQLQTNNIRAPTGFE